ncbi:MAG: PD40 domain-containing protein [Candidatus Marinimicrobia bacterium]|nr:PD40 domain-containing protein [Candidatus Neomarinimicrobiota bacterium]
MKNILLFLIVIGTLASGANPAVEKIGNPILIIESDTYYMDPLWSPDGSQIAITGSGYVGIHIYSIGGNEIKTLTTSSAAGFGMSWSHDGRNIAARIAKFENKRRYNAVAIYSVDDGSELLLSEYETRLPGTPRWAAGDRTVYLIGTKDYRSFDIPIRSAANPALDETVIYVRRNKLFSRHILSERETRIAAQEGDIVNLTVAPDGSKLAYAIYGGDLWISDIDGNNPVNLGSGHEPSWNPTSNKITFMVNSDDGHTFTSSDIYVVNADGTGRINLTATTDILEMHPDWSPDGKWIAYDTYEDGQIWMQEVR